MWLWTHGSATVIATGRGLARLDADEPGAAQVWRWPLGERSRREEPPAPRVAAVLDDLGRDVLVAHDDQLWRWAGDASAPRPIGRAPRAMCGVAPGLALCVEGALGDAALVPVRFTADAHHRDAPLRLPPAVRVTGDLGLWTTTRPAWTSGDGDWALARSPHGVTATCAAAGLVVVLDSATLAPRHVWQVPSEPGATAAAVATPHGTLVTMCLPRRAAVLWLIDGRGALVATRTKLGRDLAVEVGAPLLLDDDTALVTHAGASIFEVALPALTARRAARSPFTGDVALVAHASAGDGASHVGAVGDPQAPPHKLALHRLVRSAGRTVASVLAVPDLRAVEDVPVRGAERQRGPASVGVTAGTGTWGCAVGDTAELGLTVTSKGGPAPGLWIELSGPAVEAAHVTPVSAQLGDVTAPFARVGASWRAELAVPLVPAFARALGNGRLAKGDEPDPTCAIAVTVRGGTAGTVLLIVRVGPLGGAGATGAAMQGRAITVVAAPV